MRHRRPMEVSPLSFALIIAVALLFAVALLLAVVLLLVVALLLAHSAPGQADLARAARDRVSHVTLSATTARVPIRSLGGTGAVAVIAGFPATGGIPLGDGGYGAGSSVCHGDRRNW